MTSRLKRGTIIWMMNKKTMTLRMSILTFTMSNINIIEHKVQSPFIAMVIKLTEDGSLTCHLHHMWVTKGTGKVVITFENHADFRTGMIIDMQEVILRTLQDTSDDGKVISASIYDKEQIIDPCDQSYFVGGWTFCNDGVAIGEHVFRLSELHVEFQLEDNDDTL